MRAPLSYSCPGATAPADAVWGATPPGFRRHEAVTVIGRGLAAWHDAAAAVLRWEVKTRSGFSLEPLPSDAHRHPAGEHDHPIAAGQDRVVLARLGPLTLREPVRVVAVVDTGTRAGFAYGTRRGHPVRGEEAWVVSRDDHGVVRLTLRSLTAAAPGVRALLLPPALVLQPLYRRRYLRALSPAGSLSSG